MNRIPEKKSKKYIVDIPVKKNEKYIIDIIDNGFGGEGIAKVDGFTIFIPNALKGEKCEVQNSRSIRR